MKQTTTPNQYMTHEDLADMSKEIITAIDGMFQEQNKRFDKIEKEVQGLKKFEKKQLEANEQIIGELKTIREEQSATLIQYRRTNDKLDGHELRITHLESVNLAFT